MQISINKKKQIHYALIQTKQVMTLIKEQEQKTLEASSSERVYSDNDSSKPHLGDNAFRHNIHSSVSKNHT